MAQAPSLNNDKGPVSVQFLLHSEFVGELIRGFHDEQLGQAASETLVKLSSMCDSASLTSMILPSLISLQAATGSSLNSGAADGLLEIIQPHLQQLQTVLVRYAH